MAAQPCKECKRRPKAAGRHRCIICQLRHEPIGDQVTAARRRLAMVPEELRVKRTKTIMALAPTGTAWCAGCQTFRDDTDFGKGGTTCRACASAKTHGAMIEKTYGLTSADYDALLARQGGRCAICRGRPKSKRLAVDHAHDTGAVRGLLCARCNHDLLGSAWDSMAMATALWHYMNTPPASGSWMPPETAPQLEASGGAVRPPKDTDPIASQLVTNAGNASQPRSGAAKGGGSAVAPECTHTHYRPSGSVGDPTGTGYWRVYVEDGVELEVAPPF